VGSGQRAPPKPRLPSNPEIFACNGKTLATVDAACLCLLLAFILFDSIENAINGQANILLLDGACSTCCFLFLPGIALVVIGIKP
jgi:hypothetical protein